MGRLRLDRVGGCGEDAASCVEGLESVAKPLYTRMSLLPGSKLSMTWRDQDGEVAPVDDVRTRAAERVADHHRTTNVRDCSVDDPSMPAAADLILVPEESSLRAPPCPRVRRESVHAAGNWAAHLKPTRRSGPYAAGEPQADAEAMMGALGGPVLGPTYGGTLSVVTRRTVPGTSACVSHGEKSLAGLS
jgi:hypothetical protein